MLTIKQLPYLPVSERDLCSSSFIVNDEYLSIEHCVLATIIISFHLTLLNTILSILLPKKITSNYKTAKFPLSLIQNTL